MKRNSIRSFSLDEDVSATFEKACDTLRISRSEVINRMLLEWLTSSRAGSIVPAVPLKVSVIPGTMHQRAQETAAKELALRKATTR